MKPFKFLCSIIACLIIVGCSLGDSSSKNLGLIVYSPARSADNVMPVSVGNCGYVNEPCVSVTICTPGGTTCQTIDNILLDTGSYGLRIFSSVVSDSLGLTQLSAGGGAKYAECVGYADDSKHWGPVVKADIYLNKIKASDVPMHLIDASYTAAPNNSDCSDTAHLDSEPSIAGFNGILGVGLSAQDCGSTCVSGTPPDRYYSCTDTTCTAANMALTDQVANPASMMSTGYNNGVMLELPSVPSTGAGVAMGYLTIGIGTTANNSPASGSVLLKADSSGNITTSFNGDTYDAFLDSGSNGLYFESDVPTCASGFYCPGSTITLHANIISRSGGSSPLSNPVTFEVIDSNDAVGFHGHYNVFANLGGGPISGPGGSAYFDWGLPFFLGRKVFVGIEGKTATVNGSTATGPYWVY